jgi:hypothetical protein
MRGSVRRRSAGSERVLAICEEIYARHRLRNGEAAQGLVKPFLFNMLNERSLDKNAELLEFSLSGPVVAAVTEYLGTVPMLRGLGLLLSHSNESMESSQMFPLITTISTRSNAS